MKVNLNKSDQKKNQSLRVCCYNPTELEKGKKKLISVISETNQRSYFFTELKVKSWNSLPQDIKTLQKVTTFLQERENQGGEPKPILLNVAR